MANFQTKEWKASSRQIENYFLVLVFQDSWDSTREKWDFDNALVTFQTERKF